MAAPDRSRTAGRGASSSAKNKTKKPKKNVVHAGQRAVLNGKPVVADGRGNWRPVGGKDRTPVGTYTKGKDRTASPAKANNAFRERMGMKPAKQRAQGTKTNGTYNPNAANRKPSVEPGTNRLSRHARELERKEKAAAAAAAKAKAERERKARDNKPTKPVKPTSTKTSTKSSTKSTKSTPAEVKPATKSSQRLSDTLSGKRGLAAKKPHIKSDRLRDALKSVKKYTPKKK